MNPGSDPTRSQCLYLSYILPRRLGTFICIILHGSGGSGGLGWLVGSGGLDEIKMD